MKKIKIQAFASILIGVVPHLCGGSLELHQIYDSPVTPSPSAQFSLPQPQPRYVSQHSGNVTAVLGRSAILNCRVEAVGNRTVSWIRHKDTHLLTAGRYTYTNDQRFRAIHKLLSEDYLLQILPVKAGDSGLYECQVSTTPILSHYVYLKVAEPHTEIVGSPNIYLEEGATLNLTCLVRESPHPPQYIFWYHNNQPISYNSARGGISQITERGDTTASFLLVQPARLIDSGLYSCQPSVGDLKSVTVHVIRSADPEKWLPSPSPTFSPLSPLVLLLLIAPLLSFFSPENFYIPPPAMWTSQ